ncbi:MAG: serine hydrolase [Bacteroidales bacterium]|nr:serine hydrolase [Bacteroidales bacterium]
MRLSFLKRNKYIRILLILTALVGIALIIIYILRVKNPVLQNGSAAFYEYSSAEIDSLISMMSENQKADILIMYVNDSLQNFADNKTGFSGAFYLKNFKDSCLFEISKHTSEKFFINAISENAISSFSSDSILFANPEILNTISDKEFNLKYNSYLIQNLKNLNINALVIDYKIPFQTDSISQLCLLNKLLIKIGALHKSNILSFILIDTIPKFNDTKTSELIYSSLQELADSGLCGIIFNNYHDANFINGLKFDGFKILNLKSSQFPTADDLNNFDVLLISSKLDKNKIIGNILSLKDKQSLYLKSSKVLRAGYWANNKKETLDTIKIFPNLKLLESNLTENSITVFRNNQNVLPLVDIKQKLHIIFATFDKHPEFLNNLSKYADNYTFAYYDINSALKPYIPNNADILVVLFENYADIDSVSIMTNRIISGFSGKSIFINYGEIPADISEIKADVIVQVYTKSITAFQFSAQLIWGGVAAGGKLPSYINDSLKNGSGIFTNKIRLKYSIPEDVGLSSDTLMKIDSIVNFAISSGILPGCQIFVAKNGVVVYDKVFGYHDYSRRNSVRNTDLYDIASLTKICGTTLAMMKMVETGKIRLDDEIGDYFVDTKIDYSNIKPDTIFFIDTVSVYNKTDDEISKLVANKDTVQLDDTLVVLTEMVITRLTPALNIFKVSPRDLLLHQSGINPSLPILPYMFYQNSYEKNLRTQSDKNALISMTLPADTMSFDTTIRFTKEEAFNFYYNKTWIKDSAEVKIADGMYLRKNWSDSLYNDVKRLTVYPHKLFQYTDMNMILAKILIDTVNGKPINEFLYKEFYETLGLRYTSYNPLNYYPKASIVPTEDEHFWRNQLICGTVHDPSAAMLGGVSGNAGLFSCASDLGIIGQMWLNGGSYGGGRFLNLGTIKMFTSKQPESNRGLGFDKVAIRNLNAPSASPSTYGHTGFTGCVMWVDPENEIVFVFLSNRLHPDVNNWKILGQKVLQNTHQVVYEAILK